MARAVGVYCERCGAFASAADRPRYCPGCRLYLCEGCAGADPPYCGSCPTTGRTGSRRARRALGMLTSAVSELEAMEVKRGGVPPDDQRVGGDLLALELKAEASATAVRLALADMRPRDARRTESIRLEAEIALARFHVMADSRARSRQNLFAWLARVPLRAAGLGGIIVLAVALALARGDQPPDSAGSFATQSPHRSPAGAASERGEVEAAGPASVAPSAALPTSVHLTFDEMPTGSSLGGRWEVIGPSGTVSVVAFPTPIDRSLRLRPAGEPVSLCYRLDGAATEISITAEVLVEAIETEATLLELRDADAVLASVLLADGALMLGDVKLAMPLRAERWYRITLEATDAATDIRVEPVVADGGPPLTASTVGATGAAERVCIGLPGAMGADLYLDDLTIQ